MSNFLDNNYVNVMLDRYTIVNGIDLPDGLYYRRGGGFKFYIFDSSQNDTGYLVVTNKGIKGFYRDESFNISNGLVGISDIYVIMLRKDIVRSEKIDSILY